MTKYVVGFMFSPDKQFVALIRKNRPEWQAGKLNGIAGKRITYAQLTKGKTWFDAEVLS